MFSRRPAPGRLKAWHAALKPTGKLILNQPSDRRCQESTESGTLASQRGRRARLLEGRGGAATGPLALQRYIGPMCNRYVSPEAGDMERYWHVGGRQPWRGGEVFPRRPGPFIRRQRDSAEPGRELVLGQWGLIPWFAKTPTLTYSTNNARSEELSAKATFKQPWSRGQRCIIPALSFDEPNWESGKNVWWRFWRADGQPWSLAGLWSTWEDKPSGVVHNSYTMLTINADTHPLMSRMHKPDPKLPPDQQDKRSVIPIAPEDVDQWLYGTQAEATALLKLTPVEEFDARPIT